VYWPAFLMSAKIALPKQIYGHGFLLSRGEKMSKSVGNVVDPLALAERYGVDALRYFLLREVTFGQDGSYSHEAIVNRVNAELANSFGNLAQRSLSLIDRNFPERLPWGGLEKPEDAQLQGLVTDTCRNLIPREFEKFAFSQGLEEWMRAVFACNQYITQQEPWALKKADPERMKAVLATLFLCIRDLAIAVRPVMPTSIDRLLDMMGIPPGERNFADLENIGWYKALTTGPSPLLKPAPIFPRLELPKVEAA
ncbi:class I tRNA ligase family protein, partial [Sphingomonas sp.]|uniref:class I tRNA ligase family protein n=1 Tax=Sphingomonas sp. TaxID=28214 RepID=UPI00286BDB18